MIETTDNILRVVADSVDAAAKYKPILEEASNVGRRGLWYAIHPVIYPYDACI